MTGNPISRRCRRLLIHETGVHWIDTFRYLLGEPSAVYADLRKLNPVIKGEDAGYFIFDYDNGVRALFDGNRLLDHGAENCRTTLGEALVEGTKGTLSLAGDGSVHLRHFGDLEATSVLLAARAWAGLRRRLRQESDRSCGRRRCWTAHRWKTRQATI